MHIPKLLLKILVTSATLALFIFALTYTYGNEPYAYTLYSSYIIIFVLLTILFIYRGDSAFGIFFLAVNLIMILKVIPRFSNLFAGYALAVGDEGYDLSASKIVLKYDHLMFERINSHNVEYLQYPLLHIMVAVLNMISSIELIPILTILPVTLNLCMFLYIYNMLGKQMLRHSVNSTTVILLLTYVAYLFTGSHAQFWSHMVREAYAAPFAILTVLAFYNILFTNNTTLLKVLPIVTIAMPFSHYVTNIYLIATLLALTLLGYFLSKHYSNRIEISKLTIYLVLLAIANLVYIMYNLFMWNYTLSWIKTILNEVFYLPYSVFEKVAQIGAALPLYERLLVYLHYVALLLLLILLYVHVLRTINRGRLMDLLPMLIAVVLSLGYFVLLSGRFIPGQGRYPLMRFSPWVLLLAILLIQHLLSRYNKPLNRGTSTILKALTLTLLLFIVLGFLAQTPPLFRHEEFRLNIQPEPIMKFVETGTGCELNMGYEVIKPYRAIDNYAYVLLDSHNVHCSGVGVFQYDITLDNIIYVTLQKHSINLLIVSPKKGEVVLPYKSLIFNAKEIAIQLV